METFIKISALQLQIESKQLFDSFDLELGATQRIGITGPSGCGKTTLLRSIIQGHPPTGSNYKSFDVQQNGIAYVPQQGGLIPWFTLKRNIEFFFSKVESTHHADAISIEKDIIKGYGLEKCWRNFPSNLSGGEYQRSILACATVIEPKLFFIDEPLTEVDTRMKWIALETLTKAIEKNSAALLLVSHDVEILSYLCDEVLILGEEPAQIIKRHKLPGKHPRERLDLMGGDLKNAREDLLASLLVNKTELDSKFDILYYKPFREYQ